MSRRVREQLAVRAIEVTTRNALQQVSSEEDRARVRVAAGELFDRLEDRVLAHGGDLELLEALEVARRDLWD